MNRLLLLLFSCFALVVSAQTDFAEKQAFFDFNQPGNLHPAVTELKEAGDIYNVTDKVFTDEHGLVTVSFSKDIPDSDKIPNDALLTMEGSQFNYESYLWFFRADFMHIDAKDVEITGFYFVKTSPNGIKCNTGGMMCHGEANSWFNHDATNYSWTAKRTGIHHVDLLNTGQDATLNSLVVTYRTQMDVILPESVKPADKSEVKSFENFELKFYEPVKLAGNATFKLTGEDTEYTLTSSLSEDGKSVTLTPALEVAPGTYTLVCPEKTFYSASDDFYNPEYTYTFTLKAALELIEGSCNPVPNQKTSIAVLPKEITLTFDKNIGYVSSEKAVKNKSIELLNEAKEHEAWATAKIANENAATTSVIVTLPTAFEGPAEYYLDIPEGFIYDIDYSTIGKKATSNKKLQLRFLVGEIVRPSVEKLEEAKAALEVRGVGTPKEDAAERLALAEMVAKNKCTDDALSAAIDAFYNSTDIEMPKNGGYYTITNVAKDGTKRYLAYKDGAVTLTSDEAKAYSFLANSLENGKTTFRTFDKKYLHVMISEDKYPGISPKNVTDYNSEVNDLLLKVFYKENIERKNRMGYMTIFGAVGKESVTDPMNEAYALVYTANCSFGFDKDPLFNDKVSCVFTFTEAEAPQPEAVKYEVSPAANTVLDENGDIYISFLGSETIYADTNNLKAVLKKKDSDKEYTLTCKITHDDGKSKAQLHFTRVDDGNYSLVIPKGFFYHLGDEEQKYDLNEITVDYQVKSSDVFATDFIKTGETCILVYGNNSSPLAFNPVDVNNISVYFYSDTDVRNTYDVFATDKKFSLYNCDTFVSINGKPDPNHCKPEANGVFKKRDVEIEHPEISLYEGEEWIGYVKGEFDIESTNGYIVYLKGNYHHTKEPKYPSVQYSKGGKYTAVYENDVEIKHLLDAKFDHEFTTENLSNGRYKLILEEATIGDQNFGLYLADDSSIKKSDCHVNSYIELIIFNVNSTLPTSVAPIQILPAAVPSVYDLSGRRVSDSSRSGLYIKNGKKVFVK